MIRRALAQTPAREGERLQERKEDWLNILFLPLTPLIGASGTAAYAIAYGVRSSEPALFMLFGLVSLSVNPGYHRCFAHEASYRK